MPSEFNPYHKWLGIPPDQSAGGPNHYRLLGIQPFEADPDVIDSAADQRMAHLRSLQSGKHAALSQRLLGEVAAARVCLLDPACRAAYDEQLQRQLTPAKAAALPVSAALPVIEPKAAPPAGEVAFPPWLVATLGAVAGCVLLLVAVIAISSWDTSTAARPKAEPTPKVKPAAKPPSLAPKPLAKPAPPPAPPPKPPPKAIPDLPPGRVLLVMQYEDELNPARAACERFGLTADYVRQFDTSRRDYSQYRAIVSGSNNMDAWATDEGRRPEAFDPIEQWVKAGGHLVVLGSFNGRNCEHLQRFGIHTGIVHATTFQSAGPATDLLVEGVRDLLPASGQLRSAGSFTCQAPHEVLLRIGPGRRDGEAALITLKHAAGRLTYTGCEPNWKKDLWLITVLLNWLSRGSPVP